MRRRTFFVMLASALGAQTLAGCSGDAEEHTAPDGWHRVVHGYVAFDARDDWYEVEPPEDTRTGTWDLFLQDTAGWDDEDATIRVLAKSDGIETLMPQAPGKSAEELAEIFSTLKLIDKEVGSAGEPTQISGGADQVWKIEYPIEDSDRRDIVYVAKDDDSDDIALLGVTGVGMSEEDLQTLEASIEVVHSV